LYLIIKSSNPSHFKATNTFEDYGLESIK